MTTTQKMKCAVKWIDSCKGDAKYALLINQETGCAIDCSCGDRVFRGRKSGRACKHMQAHNAAQTAPVAPVATPETVAVSTLPAAVLVELNAFIARAQAAKQARMEQEVTKVIAVQPLQSTEELIHFDAWQAELADTAFTAAEWKELDRRNKVWQRKQKAKDLARLAAVKAQASAA